MERNKIVESESRKNRSESEREERSAGNVAKKKKEMASGKKGIDDAQTTKTSRAVTETE